MAAVEAMALVTTVVAARERVAVAEAGSAMAEMATVGVGKAGERGAGKAEAVAWARWAAEVVWDYNAGPGTTPPGPARSTCSGSPPSTTPWSTARSSVRLQ